MWSALELAALAGAEEPIGLASVELPPQTVYAILTVREARAKRLAAETGKPFDHVA